VFRNLLVPIDGSAHADRALAEAVDLASRSNARLTVMVCMPAVARSRFAGGAAFGVDLRDAREAERESEALLDRALETVPPDLSVTRLVARGRPAEAIVEQVGRGGHDLVVMGSRGHGDLHSLLLGSVSHHVAHMSPAAVLLVHAGEA
jgi:nucleotide-binding universal stress UspA family protein